MPRTMIATAAPAAMIARSADPFLSHVASALWATSGVMGIGQLLDLGILWIGQREASPQWEFMAVSNTLDAIPTLVLALGLAYLALLLRRSSSFFGYRSLALLLLVLGLGSAALGAILITDYFALSGLLTPESRALLRTTTAKGALLSGVFFLLLTPTGVMGAIRPRRDP